jgi:hypothetical protein
MVIKEHDLVDSLLRKWLIVFVVILITISINNIGCHLIYLLNSTTEKETSEIRNSKTTRLGLAVAIVLALNWGRKRRCRCRTGGRRGNREDCFPLGG